MKELDELATILPHLTAKNTKVSHASIAWHIEHSLLVINKICKALESSDPENYRYDFNFSRFIVFTSGYLPRGKGKAPKVVQPSPTDKGIAELEEALALARERWATIQKCDAKSNFQHPFFGQLNLWETQRFLVIHTKHHIKIMRAILKASAL